MRHFLTTPATLLPSVITIAELGAAMLRQEFHRPGGPAHTNGKAPIDLEVEVFLKTELTKLHPCAWHGEEISHDQIDNRDTWVVDPLDGTSDFLALRRGSALSIALLRNGMPVLGVVASPVAPNCEGDVIAWAEGTDLVRNGRPVGPRITRSKPLIGYNTAVGDYAGHNAQVLGDMRAIGIPSPAYRLALVAVGDLDATVALTNGLCSWDIAGGHALIRGAGLTISNRQGLPIDHKQGTISGCIAGDPALVSRLASLPLEGPSGTPRRPASIKRPCQSHTSLSRAQGCLLGQLAGDALGSAVEFQAGQDIRVSHPRGVTELKDGGTWNLIAGQPTDDSELALALARSLVREQQFDATAVGKEYVNWMQSNPFDIGGTTAAGISALNRGSSASSDSQANGALMRISPIGIFNAGNPELAAACARQDAILTHPSAVCREANAAFVAAIAIGIAGGSPEKMVAGAIDATSPNKAGQTVSDRISAAHFSPPSEFYHQLGWVLTAFQNAFFWLIRNEPLEIALGSTVAKGGDTDTNAAICGALLGAAQGRDAVPARWQEAILTCRPAPNTRKPRPMDYWPDDALTLAEALLTTREIASHLTN